MKERASHQLFIERQII